MTKRSGTNSTVVLAARTFFCLNFNVINFFIPLVGGVIIAALICYPNSDQQKLLLAAQALLATLIQLDGGCLGLILVGFSIYASLPSQDYVVFAISNKPEDGKYSFLKYKLLMFFKSFFWVFFCTCILVSVYSFSILYPSLDCSSLGAVPIIISPKEKLFLFIFVCAYAQIKIFVEIKIFVFTLYVSTLTQAKFVAQTNGVKPIDEFID